MIRPWLDTPANAVHHGLARAQKMLADEMGKLGPLSGLQIPGFNNE